MNSAPQLESGPVRREAEPAQAPVRLPLLTASSAKTFRRCAREYRNRYELGRVRRRTTAGPQTFGTLVHTGLEAWWRAIARVEVPAVLEEALRATREAASRSQEETPPLDLLRAEELLRGYHERWAEKTQFDYDVLFVEQTFTAPLVNPDTGAPSRTFQRAGKLDVVVRERLTERVLVIEHKTSSEPLEPGDDYWRQLTVDSQVSTYLEGCAALGVNPAACLYDVLGKPALRPSAATPVESRKYKKDGSLYANQRAEDESLDAFRERLRAHITENLERYFKRAEVVRLEDEAEDAMFDDWWTARSIRESQLAGRWPRNTDACKRYGRLCDFFDACTGVASLDDETHFRSVPAHGELGNLQPNRESIRQ
jgi:hypothetical protein